MRMTVIVNRHGKVIGSARLEYKKDDKLPFGGRMTPNTDQRVYEIEVPDAIMEVRTAEELHRKLADFIPPHGG
jgi:hypothetical protein